MSDYFLPYQKRWIQDDSPMKLYAKSRRIGITYATSYRANAKCLRKSGFTQWVTSRDELTAREFVTDYVAKWARASNVVCRGLAGDNYEVVDELHGIRAFTVEYANGSRIVSLSSTPEAFAGKGGDVLIDEADLHKDSGRVIDMALPCTTWGGQLEMVSALSVDGGPSTPFYKMLSDARHGNPMGWSLHETTVEDAVREGFADRVAAMTGQKADPEAWLAQLRAKCRTQDAWDTQYMLRPNTAAGALLPYELIAGCEVDPDGLAARRDTPSAVYAGYDVGRKKDLGVYFELSRVGDVLWQTGYRVFDRCPFRFQLDFIAERLRENRNLVRLCIDSTGMGMMLAESLQDLFGKYRVEAVNFSAPVKEALAMPLQAAFEDRRLRIAADPEIREDLHKVRKTTTAAGNIRFEGERDDAGHADRFWALALAVHAAAGDDSGPCMAEASAPPAPSVSRARDFYYPRRTNETHKTSNWPV